VSERTLSTVPKWREVAIISRLSRRASPCTRSATKQYSLVEYLFVQLCLQLAPQNLPMVARFITPKLHIRTCSKQTESGDVANKELKTKKQHAPVLSYGLLDHARCYRIHGVLPLTRRPRGQTQRDRLCFAGAIAVGFTGWALAVNKTVSSRESSASSVPLGP
jgi:hypothetical protein